MDPFVRVFVMPFVKAFVKAFVRAFVNVCARQAPFFALMLAAL